MLPLALLDARGSTVASYAYDPYGKVLSAEGTMAETNPLRYRGYYYDTESGLYYLQSRYYDPATCRFINADTTDVVVIAAIGITDKNLFAYCENNPIQQKDSDGRFAHLIIGAAVGVFTQYICDVAQNVSKVNLSQRYLSRHHPGSIMVQLLSVAHWLRPE